MDLDNQNRRLFLGVSTGIGSKSAASKNLEELSDFDEDPFKKISVWNTDQTAYDEDD